MRAFERFLKYIQFETPSCEESESCPSTSAQLVLAQALKEELISLGLSDARVDEFGYVYASIPETAPGLPRIGLIAHMDTVGEVPAGPMRARVVRGYDGGDVTLESGDVLSPDDFPELRRHAGEDLIVTDGRTLLGADDKAGIAEIMTALEAVLASGRPHGRIAVAFTPDEEIGRGADHFDVPGFGADFAYTVDGDRVGGIEYESFNAATARLSFTGRSVHPGSAKDVMVNAARLAAEFDGLLPGAERPEHTQDREGFYHLIGLGGDVEHAQATYIIRDHDRARFEARKAFVSACADYMRAKYGAERISCEITDSYYNMAEVIERCPEALRRAEDACRAAGVEPFSKPIRGGTDGSRLSFMGLPCPNLGTGGMNYHGRFECIGIQSMDRATDVLIQLLLCGEV